VRPEYSFRFRRGCYKGADHFKDLAEEIKTRFVIGTLGLFNTFNIQAFSLSFWRVHWRL
jgi:hypothetical protein